MGDGQRVFLHDCGITMEYPIYYVVGYSTWNWPLLSRRD